MPFPDVKRVIYSHNPLKLVVCQLKFPPILKIDSEIPADFQELLRVEFPNFEESEEPSNEQIPSEFVEFAPQMFSNLKKNKNYAFKSKDDSWRVNLTRTFVALSTISYEKWEIFREKLEKVVNALQQVYSPSYFTRIGLRYIDVIERSELSLENSNWNELLNEYLLGFLSSSDIGMEIENFESSYKMSLSNNGSTVKIKTGIVPNPKNEQCFVIDSDFYISKEIDNNIELIMEKLDYFNKQASRLIRWCITEELHNAMEPKEI